MARKVSSIRKSLKLRSRKNGGRKPKSAKRVVSRVGKRGGKRGGTRKNFGKRRTGGLDMFNNPGTKGLNESCNTYERCKDPYICFAGTCQEDGEDLDFY